MVATISGQEAAYLPGALSKDRASGVRGSHLREPQGALACASDCGHVPRILELERCQPGLRDSARELEPKTSAEMERKYERFRV